MGPDAVLTTSRKDPTVNRLHPSLPTSPRRTLQGSTVHNSPRKSLAATPRSALPAVPEASQMPGGSSVANPTLWTGTGRIPSSATSPAGANMGTSASPGGAAPIPSVSGDAPAPRRKHVAIAVDSPETTEGTSGGEATSDTGDLPALTDAGVGRAPSSASGAAGATDYLSLTCFSRQPIAISAWTLLSCVKSRACKGAEKHKNQTSMSNLAVSPCWVPVSCDWRTPGPASKRVVDSSGLH